MSALRLHLDSSPLFLPPRGRFAKRFERWLRTQQLKDGRPIVTMRDASELVDMGYQTVTMYRSGRRSPGKITRALLESYMGGARAPGALQN